MLGAKIRLLVSSYLIATMWVACSCSCLLLFIRIFLLKFKKFHQDNQTTLEIILYGCVLLWLDKNY